MKRNFECSKCGKPLAGHEFFQPALFAAGFCEVHAPPEIRTRWNWRDGAPRATAEAAVAAREARALRRRRADLHPAAARRAAPHPHSLSAPDPLWGTAPSIRLQRHGKTVQGGVQGEFGVRAGTRLSMKSFVLSFLPTGRDMSALMPPHDLWPITMTCDTCAAAPQRRPLATSDSRARGAPHGSRVPSNRGRSACGSFGFRASASGIGDRDRRPPRAP